MIVVQTRFDRKSAFARAIIFLEVLCMTFYELVDTNKEWSDSTELVIISDKDRNADTVRARAARTIFADRAVLWFKDDVVMLL
jgi:hypothetical protein